MLSLRPTTLMLACAIAALIITPANLKARHAVDYQGSCPVTQPPQPAFVPPAPFPAQPSESFYLGSEKLWTAVWKGPWRGVPVPGGGHRVKLPWFAEDIGAEESRTPAISVTGRRLDATALPLGVEGPSVGVLPDYYFFPSVLVVRTDGRWEITAKRRRSQLRFVIRVSQ